MPPHYELIPGQKYNKLTIIKQDGFYLNPKGDRREIKYLCKCDCGEENYYSATLLYTKKSKECLHCAYKKRPQSLKRFSVLERHFNLFVGKNSTKRGLPNTLSIEKFSEIIKLNCIYCGKEPVLKSYYTNNKIVDKEEVFYANGIDRIDSTKSYTEENCVPCCKYCNIAKNDLSQEEFKYHITKIYNFYVSKTLYTR